MESEIDGRIGAASEGAEPEGEALDLPVNLRPHPHLWSRAVSVYYLIVPNLNPKAEMHQEPQISVSLHPLSYF